MKNFLNVIGIVISVVNIIYKLATCISCDERFFGMEISNLVYFAIWTIIPVVIFYGMMQEKNKRKVLK